MKKTFALLFALLVVILVPTVHAHAAEKKAKAEEKVQISRGCPSCHVKISDEKNYTLGAEAKKNQKGHPVEAPSGAKIDDKANVEVCLECHSSSSKKAPSLRVVLHPAHNYSPTFKDKLNGNCFSCHDVNNDGKWTLLTKALKTSDKGIPIPKRKIEGAIEIKNQSPKSVPFTTFVTAIIVLGLLNIISIGLALSKKEK